MYQQSNILFCCCFLMLVLGSCTKAIIDESGPKTPIEQIVKYDPEVQTIMFNHCITCHGGAAPSGGFILSTYDDTRFYTESGNLLDRINDDANPMPPSGLISIEDRQIIAKWVEDGYLEN